MNSKQLKSNLILMLTAAIWGFAFVAQKESVKYIGPFFYNGVRFLLGGLSLIPLILALKIKLPEDKKYMLKGGITVGLFLFIAANLQQVGIIDTDAGKAGFITSLYMVIIPIIGIVLKQKTGLFTWFGVVLATLGLYLLCVGDTFTLEKGDLVILIGAFFWAGHVLLIEHFVKKIDSLLLSFMQFIVCGILGIITALLTRETVSLQVISDSLIPLLYGGLMSVGVAYTLQVVAQKNAKASHAAIILSLESCFSVIGGALILGETMTLRGYIGCIVIFAGVLISQIKKQES
ncbi:MAG: DMT family transporter [Ruminococcaceae bacterium]|nr:DMT family transporter [Oscillospiraceae bacterium]